MKRFAFSLDRVLRIRRLEMENVEAALGELAFQAQTHRHTAGKRREQAVESGQQLLNQSGLRGVDFQNNSHWLGRLEVERAKAVETAEKLAQQHRQKITDLIEARRTVKLLETLRKKKHNAHKRETEKHLEAQASEFYLAKRIRDRR
jgi:flagellar biosynthesis chaperone FliJ